jgi:hypothetical protein
MRKGASLGQVVDDALRVLLLAAMAIEAGGA